MSNQREKLMQIEVTGQNMDITQALRAYVSEKSKRLERRVDNLMSARFVLSLQKVRHVAQGTLTISGRPQPIHAEADAEDMYAAIDALMDRLDKRVRRSEERRVGKERRERRETERE